MGLKDLKLFPMEHISVTKIQGRTNTRHKGPSVSMKVVMTATPRREAVS